MYAFTHAGGKHSNIDGDSVGGGGIDKEKSQKMDSDESTDSVHRQVMLLMCVCACVRLRREGAGLQTCVRASTSTASTVEAATVHGFRHIHIPVSLRVRTRASMRPTQALRQVRMNPNPPNH